MSKKRKMREYKEETGNRRSREYLYWRQKILIQDSFTCQYCHNWSPTGKGLVVHHLDSFTKDESAQGLEALGATLCQDCHLEYHRLYSYDSFDRHSFYIWIENKNKD